MITLEQVKEDLKIIHDFDDNILDLYLRASVDEAERFIESSLPTQDIHGAPVLCPSVCAALFLLIRAKSEGGDADEVMKLRRAAETLLMPFRQGLGP